MSRPIQKECEKWAHCLSQTLHLWVFKDPRDDDHRTMCSMYSTRSSLECDYWVGKFPKDGLYTFVPFILADQNQAITKQII